MIDAVAKRGDAALLEFTAKFDGAALAAEQLPVTTAELMTASLKADKALRDAIKLADKNVAAFAKKSRRKNWSSKNAQGAQVGEKFDAVVTQVDAKTRKVNLSIKALEIAEEKEAVKQFGSSDSGASLGDILGAALKNRDDKSE